MATNFRVFTIPQLHPSIWVHQEIQHTGYLPTGQFLIHDNAAFGADQLRSQCLVKCRYLNQLALKEIQQPPNKISVNFCIPFHVKEKSISAEIITVVRVYSHPPPNKQQSPNQIKLQSTLQTCSNSYPFLYLLIILSSNLKIYNFRLCFLEILSTQRKTTTIPAIL